MSLAHLARLTLAPLSAALAALAVLAVLGTGCGSESASDPPLGTAEEEQALSHPAWTERAPMTEARAGVAVKLLDGRVLAAAGGSTGTSAELYDPQTDTWTRTGNDLEYAPNDPSAEGLLDGRVRVGGKSGPPWKSAIYDPGTDEWTLTKNMPFGDAFGRAVLLDDGRVLSAGGYSANTRAQLYDPVIGTWKSTSNQMKAVRWDHSVTKLADGRVLVVGGSDGNGYIHRPVELYDPATGKWTTGGKTVRAHVFHTATRLPNGTVMVVAGEHDYHPGSEGVPMDTTEIYAPETDTWTEGPPLHAARSRHTATLLEHGALLVTGGFDSSGSALSSAELYDGVAWTTIEPMFQERTSHTATLLDDGSVLVAGGTYQATTELFRLAPNGAQCSIWGTCASAHCVEGVCCESACDDGCRSCAAPGFEGTCITPCVDDTHAGVCQAKGTCAPYRCQQGEGVCGTRCDSVHDCAAGFVCNLAHRCVAPPDVAGGDPGMCGVRVPSPAGDTSPWTGPLLAFATLWWRRRRHRRRLIS